MREPIYVEIHRSDGSRDVGVSVVEVERAPWGYRATLDEPLEMGAGDAVTVSGPSLGIAALPFRTY